MQPFFMNGNNVLLEVDEFESLIIKAGLNALVSDFRRRGYTIRPINSNELSFLHTTVCHSERKELLFHKRTLTQYPEFSEVDCFIAAMLHEFGHLIAAERGLEYNNEELAWKLGKEISPISLPDCYSTIEKMALKSYKKRIRSGKVSITKQCPDCAGFAWGVQPKISPSYDGTEWELCVKCGDCQQEFIVVFPGTLHPAGLLNPLAMLTHHVKAIYRAELQDN